MTDSGLEDTSALGIAASVRSRKVSAVSTVKESLDRIERFDGLVNCFTAVLAERAVDEAAQIDAATA